DHADRAGVGRPVTQAAAPAVDRAGVHARPAADALEAVPEVGRAQAVPPGVVHQHDVQLPALPRAVEVGGVLRDRRAQGAAGEHADEDPEVAGTRDQLLDADAGDVQRRHGGADVGVALVGADDEPTGLGHGEVGAGHAGVGRQEAGPGVLTHRLGQVVG